LLKRRINQQNLDKRKTSFIINKLTLVQNQEAMKQIEMVTESIPQLILKIYIFQKKNDIFNVFSTLKEIDFFYLSQIGSIFTSSLSIIFGLVGIYGYKAFYYYEQKRILLDKIRHPEKGVFQKIGRFISLMIWYFSVVISRILLIALILSYKPLLIILLLSFILITSLILGKLEKNYFKQKKFLEEFEKETTAFRDLYIIEHRFFDIGELINYKPKSVLKLILTFFYMIL
jgi:hypothetical protein